MKDTIFNEMSIMIIKEGKKADCHDYDHDFCISDFEDTLKGLDKTQMTYTIDSLPILKQEIDNEIPNNKDDDCDDCCCESYLIEYDILQKLIESYEDINNEFEAHHAICEHYNIDPKSLAVVFECDYIAKGLLQDCKTDSTKYNIMRSYSNTIKNMINKGIRCCKKA